MGPQEQNNSRAQGVPKPPVTPAAARPNDDLNAEGIELVGSAVSFDNEFTTGATDEREAAPVVIQSADEAPQEPESPARAVPQSPTPPVPPAPPTPKASQQPRPAQDAPRNDPSIKPIRTYRSDAEEAVRYGGASKVSMAVAEQQKKEREGIMDLSPRRSSLAGALAAFGLVAIIAAGGAYYWLYLSPGVRQDAPSQAASISTMIPAAKASLVVVEPESKPLQTIARKLQGADAGLGNVYAIIPVSTATSTSMAPVSSVFAGTRMPNRLLRSLGERYMVGLYTFETPSPFIILTDTYFQNAFSGMLEWERDLAEDLQGFISLAHPDAASAALDKASFKDEVISNVDTRILQGEDGQTLLAYAFADKDTLVIATTETSLTYALERLLQVRTIQ
ncbi:MAG TPA: hypothetical protein VFQ72_01950 [Candidatus Paceibacterota bacterium]|nr:hypothetical protein [Candidatus Paceibacterota bacterium]